MSELKIKLIYDGEESYYDFLNAIYGDDNFKLDKHVWSGEIKIGRHVFIEKDQAFNNICFKIFFSLQDKKKNPNNNEFMV